MTPQQIAAMQAAVAALLGASQRFDLERNTLGLWMQIDFAVGKGDLNLARAIACQITVTNSVLGQAVQSALILPAA